MTTITAQDPKTLNAMAQQAMNGAAVPVEPEVDERSLELPDTTVELPGGFLTMEGSVITEAEVRELNGFDEEEIFRAGNMGRALLKVLERGLVSVGGEKVTKDTLESMLMGDREAVLLAIRRVTFGDEMSLPVVCQHCGDENEIIISLKNDVPIRRLDDPADRFFRVQGKRGVIEVQLPVGNVHREMLSNSDKSIPEMNTILLGSCVQSINGTPSMGVPSVLKLGIPDRRQLAEEISARNPGPRLTSIEKACPSCGEAVTLGVSMAELFRF